MFYRHFHGLDRHLHMFEKGDLKYIILDLIKDKPSHGYEIIRNLEDRFHGFYTPSPGSVYPTLQLLEDMDYVSSSEHDGKKIHTITSAGIKFLNEKKDHIDRIKLSMKDWWNKDNREEFRDTIHEVMNLNKLLHHRLHKLESAKLAQINGIVAKASKEIEKILE